MSPGMSQIERLTKLLRLDGAVLAVLISVAALAWLGFKLSRHYFVSFLNLPGPAVESILKGNLPAIDAGLNGEPVHSWLEEYGDTILIRHAFYRPDIVTRDPGFIGAMIHSEAFSVGDSIQRWFRLLGIGHALAAVHNGEDHSRVKKAMMPAFGVPAIRSMWPEIMDITRSLAAKIQDQCTLSPDGKVVIPTKEYAGLLSLEVLGKSGFGYDFGAISSGKPNEIAQVINGRVRGGKLGSGWFGWLDYLDYAGLLPIPISPNQRRLASQQGRLHDVSRRIFDQRKQEVLAELPKNAVRNDFSNKDIVSVLLRANMASDLLPSQRMSEKDIMVQVPQIVIAGNETTVGAIVWGLHYLSTYPETQEKLRAEIRATTSDDWETVQNLPYLDATVREILRLDAPGATMTRTCLRKTTVPLRNPVRGRDGKMMQVATVDKGTIVKALRYEVNTHLDLFGDDGTVFRPERHLEDNMEEAKKLGGTWGNNVTFSGGQRSCIGYRLAVAEIKAMLFVFMSQFKISEPVGQRVDKVGMLTGHSIKVTGGDKASTVGLVPTIFQSLSM